MALGLRCTVRRGSRGGAVKRIRVTSEIWKGAALGVATLVAFLTFYELLSITRGSAVGATSAEHLEGAAFLGRILLAALLPSALVGGLLGALSRHLRKARTLTLAVATFLGTFVVVALSFALLSLGQGEPLKAVWFGLLMCFVLAPLHAPFALVSAAILARWTRPGLNAGRNGAAC